MSDQLCLNLISSTGTRLFVASLADGICYPVVNDFVLQDAIIPGDTSFQVAPLTKVIRKGEEIKLYKATLTSTPTLIGIETVAQNVAVGATTINIQPAKNIALSGDIGRSIGLVELHGIESTPFQSQTEVNQVTLLNSGGGGQPSRQVKQAGTFS